MFCLDRLTSYDSHKRGDIMTVMMDYEVLFFGS